MSEYTHYFAVRSDDAEHVRSVLSNNRILSIVARSDEYPGEAAWGEIPSGRKWVVLSVDRAMRQNAQGQYIFDDPWNFLPPLFPTLIELFIDELPVDQAAWELKLADNGETILILDNKQCREWPIRDLERIGKFFSCSPSVFQEHLAPGHCYEFCRAVGLPFFHLVADAGFPSGFLMEKMKQNGFSFFPEELEKL